MGKETREVVPLESSVPALRSAEELAAKIINVVYTAGGPFRESSSSL